MNILITGIHGFVGTNLVKSLSKEHILYGLDIISPERVGVKHTFSWNDLDKGGVPEVDVIIHLAGKAHDTKNRSKADVYFEINTKLTQRVYDYYLTSSAKKFIFFSSVKAAVDNVPDEFLTEDVPTNPVGPYGESKVKAEEYIQTKWKITKKRTYILRPCMIHGPGNKGNLNLLNAVVRKGIPWPLGSFENRRSFTSIDNLCFVIQGLLSKEIATGIYQMSDDDSLSTNELIEVMCTAMGKKVRIWHLPKGMMRCLATIGTWLHFPLNLDRLRKLTENYVVSNAKIKTALGIIEMPVSARDGLKKTIKSFEDIK